MAEEEGIQAGQEPDLKALLAEREQRLAELEGALSRLKEEREAEAASLKEALKEAARKYRGALLASSPELPEELISGETVAEVEASMQKARAIVDKVRKGLEARRGVEKVPAGSPARSAPDLSSLPPAEKIAMGLGKLR